MNLKLLLTLCLVAIFASLIPTNAAPADLVELEDEEDDPIDQAVDAIAEQTLLLAEGLSEMIEKASEDDVTEEEAKAMCNMFYEEYKNILRQMEELRRIAAENGTMINIDIDPEDVWDLLAETLADARLSPKDLTVIIFDAEGPLSGDDTKLDLFVTMFNRLSRMAAYEAKYNLIQADGPEDVQNSLDNIISITGAIMEVANGLMETVEDEVSQMEEHGGPPKEGDYDENDDDDDDDDSSEEQFWGEKDVDVKEEKETPPQKEEYMPDEEQVLPVEA